MKNHALFIFRRDLRLNDNTALNKALQNAKKVSCCFIIDPRQVENINQYRSEHALTFMGQSLKELSECLEQKGGRLLLFYGQAEDIISKLLAKALYDALYFNNDYTPFSRKRDEALQAVAKKYAVFFESIDDALLQAPEVLKKKDNTPYSMFTPFYKKALTLPVQKQMPLYKGQFCSKNVEDTLSVKQMKKLLILKDASLATKGGSSVAHAILRHIDTFNHYAKDHNTPAHQTTLLSAHLKFGTLSIRECYYAIKERVSNSAALIRALYWRDFFTYLLYHNPEVLKGPFRKKFAAIEWTNDKQYFEAWCTGNTGFPLIDAGMRQLNQTGFMHNRVRLVVASFLVKDLFIDWRWGEKYFAQQLTEYDPAVNNGNWQWCASTGCDSTPYFRIFNPWLQQKKFDPECVYIKQWIPELKAVPVLTIHHWYKKARTLRTAYPQPLVDHTNASGQVRSYLKKLVKSV